MYTWISVNKFRNFQYTHSECKQQMKQNKLNKKKLNSAKEKNQKLCKIDSAK